jgi:mitochondrial fission protein ELM1
MASQALGFAEATGFPFIGKRLGIHFTWVCLPPAALVRAVPYGRGYRCELATTLARSGHRPPPECSDAGARDLRAGGENTVAAQIQNPGIGRAEFDLLVVSQHDCLRGPGVIDTRAAVHRATQASLAAERRRFPALATMPPPIPRVLISGNQ